MAQIASNPPTERISHLLPTVKCSSCTQPVPLDQLGDHVCPPPSNLSSDTKPVPSPLKAQTLPRPPSNASTRSPMSIFFPRRRPSAAPNPRDVSLTPSRAPSRNAARSPAPSLSQSPRPPSRAQTQRQELSPNVVVPSVPRPGGSISTRSAVRTPSPLDTRSPVLRRPSNPRSHPDAPSPVLRRPSNPQSSLDSRSPDQRRPSIPQPPLNTRSPIQRRPSAPQSPPDAPSPVLRRPSNPQSSLDTRSPVLRRPSTPKSPPNAPSSVLRRPSDPRSQFAQATNYGASDDKRSALMPQSNHQPVRSVTSPSPSSYSSRSFVSPEIDTKSGGAAGMAGVGRRGFAAAARAAMFTSSPPSRVQRPTADMPAPWIPRSSSPQRVNTPPSGNLNPPTAPPMPYSSRTAPHPSTVPSPPRDSRSSSNIPLSQSLTSSTTPPPRERRKPSSIPFPVKPSDSSKSSNAPEPLTPTTPVGQRFSSEKPSHKKATLPGDAVKVVTQDDMNSSVLGRPSEDEESEFGGLAYAEGDDGSDDGELLARGMVSARVHHSPSASSTYSDDHPPTERASKEIGLDKALAALLRSPTSTDTPLSPASSNKHIRASKPPMRSLTSHVQRDPPAQGTAIIRRGATISGAYSGPSDKSRNDRSSQESTASGLAKHREKALTCLRCSKDIEDKRWISVENGRGVLCDKCWKNMYLPKCRRCNLPIEKQAVSSSDGQLKGKYHRDCFNCHTCHKPFPDRTFYVFDGKPFCDYHYHESNNSLCAAPDCGRPIEGPCAVSHTGDRYHVEHLICEHEGEDGERCDERLVDYWEIEGRMLCERHMRRVVERDMMSVGLDRIEISSDSRAMRRKTQFIDIAGLR